MTTDTSEVRVAIATIPMNGMVQAGEGEAKALFVRDKAGVRAFQANCPHYGAPLAKGAICGTTLYCPWHKAAFDIADGSLCEPPALDHLDRYPVRLEGDTAVATLQSMARPAPAPIAAEQHFIIVGTGAAGVAAAITLRREGFAGRLTMVGREPGEPYDRPKLSKNFLAKATPPEAMLLQPDFFAALRVEAITAAATAIDPAARRVTLDDGRTLTGDAVLIATGSRASRPSFPGGDLDGIYTLRSLADAVAISGAAAGGARVVIVGAGFIGLEAAAFLTKRGLQATVVSPDELPFATRFGAAVARAIKLHHEASGVRFVQGKVERFAGAGRVCRVHLADGSEVDADFVLLATGAKPETELVHGADRRDDGGIRVGSDLAVAPHVYVAGDIAAFPEVRTGVEARIEHWRLAEQQGMHIAHAMLGRKAPFTNAPFFWSNQGDKRLDYAGYAPDWDEIVTTGDPAALDFISYYVKDGSAQAACAIGQAPRMVAFLHALESGRAPKRGELETLGA